jgi:nucleotide-binding universal stress UspA family protein
MPSEIKLGQLLYATDLTSTSLEALPCAATLANDYHAKLILLHVAANEKEAREAHNRLATLVSQQNPVADIELRIATGAPASTIVTATKNSPIDLVVMGVRGGGAWERLATHAPGPVAYNVVAQASCPVLTIRSHEVTFKPGDRGAE